MARQVYEVNDIDLSVGGNSDPIELNGTGPISIQPVEVLPISGNPKYTVEVSNDGKAFVDYHKSATDVAIDDSIWIGYENIPWQFMRISISATGTGTVRFKLYINGYDG